MSLQMTFKHIKEIVKETNQMKSPKSSIKKKNLEQNGNEIIPMVIKYVLNASKHTSRDNSL